ncbi:MAG TPA: hypothetical protein VI685_13090 [Candidatus Angelobacter sp.]
MRLIAILAMLVLTLGCVQARGQQGTAPDGYYPPGYMGDTWTGTITAVDADKREITLTYTDKKGPHNFVAYVPEHYKVHLKNGQEQEVKMADFEIGRPIRVYYIAKTIKMDNQKVKRNEIIKIEIISPEKRS